MAKQPKPMTRAQNILLSKIEKATGFGLPIRDGMRPDLFNLVDHGKIELQYHSEGSFAKAVVE